MLIAFLRGLVHEIEADAVIIDVGGVGYKASISQATWRDLPERGSEVELHIHTHLREDALMLFGFSTRAEMETFQRLIQVSGIGPRLALAVLSSLPPQTLARAVAERDLKALTRVSGVGRKTAERLMLELKDKLQLTEVQPVTTSTGSVELAAGPVQDAVAALIALGYSMEMSQAAVNVARQALGEENTVATSDLVRAALRQISA